MKFVAFVRFCFSAICFVVLSHLAVAQDSVFTAKQGLAAAQEALSSTQYADAYLVGIQTVYNQINGTYSLKDGLYKYWNGLSHDWKYTFFYAQDSSYHTFRVENSQQGGFTASISEAPDNLDSSRIPDGWIDSDSLSNILLKEEAWPPVTSVIRLSFDWYNSSELADSMITWRAENSGSWTFVDAYTGEYFGTLIVGINDNNFHGKISLYPNPSSSNITIQFPEQNFTIIEIRTILGELVTSLKIENSLNSYTIPIEKFPSSGQYFLHLKGKNPAVVPVTIYH